MQPHFHFDEDGRSGKGLGGDWRRPRRPLRAWHGMARRTCHVKSQPGPRPLTLLCSSCHINSTCAPSDARPLSSTLQRTFPSPARFALRLRQGEAAKLVARHLVTRYKVSSHARTGRFSFRRDSVDPVRWALDLCLCLLCLLAAPPFGATTCCA
jgi:hypothetical protein